MTTIGCALFWLWRRLRARRREAARVAAAGAAGGRRPGRGGKEGEGK